MRTRCHSPHIVGFTIGSDQLFGTALVLDPDEVIPHTMIFICCASDKCDHEVSGLSRYNDPEVTGLSGYIDHEVSGLSRYIDHEVTGLCGYMRKENSFKNDHRSHGD